VAVPENDRVTYDSVTIHFESEERDPVTITRVIELTESHFPTSGERALQVLDDPKKGPPRSLFEAEIILFRPEEILHLVLREGEKTTTVDVEEVIG